jgi:GNAT superfamily N-acetyltransferase
MFGRDYFWNIDKSWMSFSTLSGVLYNLEVFQCEGFSWWSAIRESGIWPLFRKGDKSMPIDDLEIRPAGVEELPQVLQLYEALEFGNHSLDLASAQRILERMQAYPSYTLYVALSGSELLGTFALLIMDNLAHQGAPSGIIEDFVVHPSWQRKGIGSQMMAFAMQRCREAGCYKLVLSSSELREQAHHFYSSLGFKHYGYCFVVNLSESAQREVEQDETG